MNDARSQPKDVRKVIARQLDGTRKALKSLIDGLEERIGKSESTTVIEHQLTWATVHLYAAILALRGEAIGVGIGKPSRTRATRQGDPPAPAELAGASGEGKARAGPPAPPPQGGIQEVLRGHTQAFGIAEILGFIASLRKSGTLAVHGQQEDFLIDLKDGAVIYAQGNSPPDGLLLGQILVAQGAILPDALDGFLRQNPSRREVLGAALLKEGLISRDALRIALSYQVQHVFHRIYVEKNAYYQFEEEVHRVDSEDVLLNVQGLLLESARYSDEKDRDLGDARPAA